MREHHNYLGDSVSRYSKTMIVYIFMLYLGIGVTSGGYNSSYRSTLQDLCLVVLGPYPDSAATPNFQPRWDGGPALITAARLAAEAINNRTDVLAGYRLRLLEGDSGCNVESKAVISLVKNAFHGHQSDCPVVGIVGPACSEAATIIGGVVALDESSLLHISPSATSPALSDSSVYTNTYRMLSSSLEYIRLYSDLINHNAWNNVAALYDTNRIYLLSTFYQSQTYKINISYMSPVSPTNIPLADIRANNKVIFVFAGEELSRNILCLAHHFNPPLTYPIYQWIFQDITEDQFWQDVEFSLLGTIYSCSRQQMIKATEGIFLNVYHKRDDILSPTDVGFTLDAFYKSYTHLLTQHLMEVNLTQDQYTHMAEDRAPLYYDAVWAIVMALDRAESELMHFENISLSSYKYGNPQATTLIKEQLNLLNFEGLSGKIMFRNETQESATIIDIYQIQYNASASNSNAVLVGFYNDSRLEITESANVVPSSFGMVQESIHPSFTVIFAILILLCTGSVATLHILIIKYSHSPSIRASSPRLSQLIFSGCYLVMFLGFSLILVTSKWFVSIFEPLSREHFLVYGVFCNVAPWNISIGYTLILSSLLVQLWRIYNIFNKFRKQQFFLSDESLVCIVAVLLALNCIIHLTWVSTDPYLATFTTLDVVESYNGFDRPVIPLRFKCASDSASIFDGITIGLNGLLSICLILLSILNRHIQKRNFKNSGVSVFVYVFVVITLFGSFTASAFGNDSLLFVVILWELCFLISVFLICVLLFLPRVISAINSPKQTSLL